MLNILNRNDWKLQKIWSWRSLEKISSIDHVRNEEVLQRVKEERNILHTVKKKVG